MALKNAQDHFHGTVRNKISGGLQMKCPGDCDKWVDLTFQLVAWQEQVNGKLFGKRCKICHNERKCEYKKSSKKKGKHTENPRMHSISTDERSMVSSDETDAKPTSRKRPRDFTSSGLEEPPHKKRKIEHKQQKQEELADKIVQMEQRLEELILDMNQKIRDQDGKIRDQDALIRDLQSQLGKKEEK